jgi:2-polyprenyl-3-methyl-5-hydroxy-6-metoxy-1,4-benzoquinol methylase
MISKNIQKKARLIVDNVSGKKIVDLGSSEGELHKAMEGFFGSKIISVDILGKPDIEADFNKRLPIPSGSIDSVIASEVIEHLDSPLNFLLECKRIVKKQGRIIITTPNSLSIAEFQGLISKEKPLDYTGHLYGWNKITFERLIDRARLKVKKFKHISFFWNRNYLFRTIANLIPVLRPNLFFVLVK